MYRLLVLAVLLSAFAGCVDRPEPVDAPSSDTKDDSGVGNKRTSYAVDPETANETELEGAHLHDEWGESTAMMLADTSVRTADCSENPMMDLFILGSGLFSQQEVHKGCARFTFDSGMIVPEGTARLTIDVDASEALPQGGMELLYGNGQKRAVALEESTEAVYTWTIEMEATEWDLPHSTETDWWFFLRPSGTVAILDGTIDVIVVAERMDDWEPILGSEHIDHWTQTDQHDFIAPGVLRALDTNTTVHYPSFADRITGAEAFAPIPLDDIIPPETKQVTLAVKWGSVDACPAAHECWIVSFLAPANGGRWFLIDPSAEGADWAIYTYDVPEPMAPDSTYAEESVYSIRAFVRACPNGESQQTGVFFFNGCMGEAVASMSAETRFEVVAWKDGADVGAVKTRLGLS